MQQFRTFSSTLVPLPNENVDTDQIIPARFLKTTEKSGLGKVLFYDWRYDAIGSPLSDFVLNNPAYAGSSILLAGNNFGCGSSREHAPWALADFGFKAIISTAFADIFRNNCLKNGLLPVQVDRGAYAVLVALVSEKWDAEVTIDLCAEALILPNGAQRHYSIDSFSKKCLLEGVDELGYLLLMDNRITEYESTCRSD